MILGHNFHKSLSQIHIYSKSNEFSSHKITYSELVSFINHWNPFDDPSIYDGYITKKLKNYAKHC